MREGGGGQLLYSMSEAAQQRALQQQQMSLHSMSQMQGGLGGLGLSIGPNAGGMSNGNAGARSMGPPLPQQQQQPSLSSQLMGVNNGPGQGQNVPGMPGAGVSSGTGSLPQRQEQRADTAAAGASALGPSRVAGGGEAAKDGRFGLLGLLEVIRMTDRVGAGCLVV